MQNVNSISNTISPKPVAINIEALYQSQNERLRRFIQKRIWHKEDAEEVLQLTYLEAMRCKEKFNGGSKPETWLFGIAVNLTRNYFKQHYGQTHLEEMTDSIVCDLQAEVEENPAILVEHERMLVKTVEAMDSLPEDTQSILQMIVDGDYSYQDTATQIGVPIGTIRSRLSRARQVLKRYLD
ncbi:RNA polymerase sigma factor [Vibrio mangrovi]|uniref:RNA polymerase sigma factor n=1 Tax=Vibrio mangrovi TaxID=474394 RepID=A0A1Y6J081_9VIBR|nr:RNA polymerase sigma factor [Vibrio mangrovi]MDW6001972.1 RNA polymerase sigma factor [Vibrio mangrovi]SMS02480.1 ECF RNA polymerase sigma-E factor [Vibrio mangrovi]